MAVSLATPCKNCGHPLNVHDDGGDSRVVRTCITCSCMKFEPDSCYWGHSEYCEHQDPPVDKSNRCKARFRDGDGLMLRCDIMLAEAARHIGDHGQDVQSGRVNWTDSLAMYPASEGLPDAPMNREVARHAQVGGDHYKKHKIQHWDIVDEYGLNYFEGAIVKYVLRHRDKNGVEDLKKARHTLDKLIELEEGRDGGGE